MKRSDAIDLLIQSKPILADRYGVTHVALFGSTARDSAGTGSDVDVLVAFDGAATSARYFGVQFYLDLISHNVQLVIPAKAGIQSAAILDTGFRRCDGGKSVGICTLRWSAELHG